MVTFGNCPHRPYQSRVRFRMRFNGPYPSRRTNRARKRKHVLASSRPDIDDYIAGLWLVNVEPIIIGIAQIFFSAIRGQVSWCHSNVPGFWSMLRDNPNYRYTWMGQVVSEVGDHFNSIAVFSLACTSPAPDWPSAAS